MTRPAGPPKSIVLLKVFSVLGPKHRFSLGFCDLRLARDGWPNQLWVGIGYPVGCPRLENIDFLKDFFNFQLERIVLLKLFNVLSPDHRFLQRFCDLWVARPAAPEPRRRKM